MKLYISADIEGVAGINSWDETEATKSEDYAPFRRQMTEEVKAAIEGAAQAGATQITVRDAHDTARNLLPAGLPRGITLIRGWSGHPAMMMEGLDETYDAVFLIGYHSPGGSGANPLSHTMSSSKVAWMELNGKRASEFLLNTLYAASLGVRVALVTGDEGLMQEVKAFHPGILTFSTGRGVGRSTYSVHPADALEAIRSAAAEALALDHRIELPESFTLDIRFLNHADAYRASFYPGARLAEDTLWRLETDNIFDVHRAIGFVL